MLSSPLDSARTPAFAGLRLLLAAIAAISLGGPIRAVAPTDGPGGPILLVTSSVNPFSGYYAEILRAEGLNAFTTADVDTVSAAMLSAYDVVLLGDMPLQAGQVSMLDAWVRAGGNLIAMRPDKQLYGLLGLTDDAALLSNKYLGVNTAVVPGAGITGATMPFHGTADLATSNGAATVATLYSNAATATTHPAVTVRLVGIQGGQAAAFMFDLARSVVYTRQGNPLWAGQDRDGNPPVRATDLFIGAAAGDVQPNWNDMNKSHIPHADEQQRLLANVVLYMNRDRKPLPRFWYLPRGAKAAVVMTGDEHGSNNFIGRLSDLYNSPVNSPPGCSVDDWQCTRATAYIYALTSVSPQTITQLAQQGFEIAMHPTTTGQPGGCTDFTAASLDTSLTTQLQQFALLSAVPPRTSRTHCVVWSDYTTEAEIELQHNIRLDTTYYAWPPEFIQNRPGFFTGAAMPMRFARATGEMLDIYQAATQMTDESAQAYPETIQVLIDRALGPDGYFGVFTANMHTDFASGSSTNYAADIVAAARSQQVPVVSAAQMLDWLDGRNQSAFGSIAWNGSVLSFTVTQAPGARGLNALLPVLSGRSAAINRARRNPGRVYGADDQGNDLRPIPGRDRCLRGDVPRRHLGAGHCESSRHHRRFVDRHRDMGHERAGDDRCRVRHPGGRAQFRDHRRRVARAAQGRDSSPGCEHDVLLPGGVDRYCRQHLGLSAARRSARGHRHAAADDGLHRHGRRAVRRRTSRRGNAADADD